MTDYTELVKALRICTEKYYELSCTDCQYHGHYPGACRYEVSSDAADAIEELQAEVDELKQKNTDLLNVREVSNDDMERILEVLRNIPVGPIESIVEQLPKRGEWIKHEDDACECSVCGLGLNSFVEGIFYNFCPFCGADMRAKMEVEE